MSLFSYHKETRPWRFEYKYLIPVAKLNQVRNAVIPFVKHDSFSDKSPDHTYLVKSLYFDTPFLNFYQEKVNGDCDRLKFRIRTYSNELNNNSTLRAEIKVRKGALMEKYSTFITLQEYNSFLISHHWNNNDDPVLIEFIRYFWMKSLHPQIIVQYNREGFIAKDKSNIRITLDYNVSSTTADSLSPKYFYLKEHHKQSVILEIKCQKNQPPWLQNLIKDHGLKIVSSSKFAKGIEISKFSIVNPSWSS